MNSCHYVNSYIQMNSRHHVNSYIAWIHTLHVNSYIVWILTYHVNSYIVWIHTCHHCPRNTNTRIWGLRLACNHVVWHDGFHSSCCLSESKNKSESTKEIWNEIDSYFQTNCRCLMKRTGHCAWPRHSFSWSDHACNHPSCCKTCCSLRPCCPVNHDHGVNCLNDNS